MSTLETRISHHNKIDEKRQKEIELLRAHEESRRAKTLVEERKLPPPKPSKILEIHHKHLKKDKAPELNKDTENEFKEPLMPPRKMQKTGANSFVSKGKEVLGDVSNSGNKPGEAPVLKKQISDENAMNAANQQPISNVNRTTESKMAHVR